MKFNKYLGFLAPTFKKDQMLDEIRIAREELENYTIPSIERAIDVYGKEMPKNKISDLIDKKFDEKLDRYRKGTQLNTMLEAAKSATKSLDSIANLVRTKVDDVILKDKVSFIDVNLMRYVEVANFVSGYIRRFLLITYNFQNPKLVEEDELRERAFNRNFEWLLASLDPFSIAIRSMSLSVKEVEEKFEEIPDILIHEDTVETNMQVHGVNKTDPFSFRLISARFNIIFHIRMQLLKRQIANHNQAKQEAETIELQLQDLHQRKRDGERDARLEKMITYNEDELESLRRKIRKLEPDYE